MADKMGIAFPVSHTIHPPGHLLLLLLALVFGIAGRAGADPPQRGEAQVAVIAHLDQPAETDQVSIRLVGNADPKPLQDLALTLGAKIKATPLGMSYTTGDPEFIRDKSIGLEFTMPVVPRHDGYLPIAPFVEVFAPHVSELRIVYIVHGNFRYRGVNYYKRRGLSVTVDPPEVNANAPDPIAFYGIHVMISNPSLTSVEMPRYAAEANPWLRVLRVLGLVLLAGVVGAGIGILFAKWLARWKASNGY